MSQVAMKMKSFCPTCGFATSKKLTNLQKKTTVSNWQLTNNVTKT